MKRLNAYGKKRFIAATVVIPTPFGAEFLNGNSGYGDFNQSRQIQNVLGADNAKLERFESLQIVTFDVKVGGQPLLGLKIFHGNSSRPHFSRNYTPREIHLRDRAISNAKAKEKLKQR